MLAAATNCAPTASAQHSVRRRIVLALTAASLMLCVVAAATDNASASAVVPAPKVRAFKLSVPGYAGLRLAPAISNVPSQRERVKVTYNVIVTFTVTITVKHKGKKKTEKKLERKLETRTRFVVQTVDSKQDWVVVNNGLETDVLSVTAAGKVGVVASSLLPPATAPSGQTSVLPTYGSVQADGYVWVLDYSAPLAPLYAISPDGHAQEVATLTGDFTDMTVGPADTLVIADNAGNLDRCTINKQPHATCKAVPVPPEFDGGQVEAVGQAGGRVWFTDDLGELASFSPAKNTFAGPYGDLSTGAVVAGEVSADPRTIAVAANGDMFVAAGEGSNPLFQNNLIRAINPRTGARLGSYTSGLTNVVALTAASDGNIWFLNETNTTTGAGTVGMLNTAKHTLQEYNLPKGYRLPVSGISIDPGPLASNTVFFTLQTTTGAKAAIGEVTGISRPA